MNNTELSVYLCADYQVADVKQTGYHCFLSQ